MEAYRDEFDISDKQRVEQVTRLNNCNTTVWHMVGNPIVIAARDSVEKRIYFQAK